MLNKTALKCAFSNDLISTPMGFPVVAIGASAGGLEAFEAFFKAMPADSGMAFVLVAHLDPTHTSLLPELVQKCTQMKVFQIRDGVRAQQNCVYVIPPNKNLTLLNGAFQLLDFPTPKGLNLPIDIFFRALATDQGPRAVCIILSGTGSDGSQGLRAIKDKMGMVMVQSEASAKYDGMPRSAISTGMVDVVLSPEEMPSWLMKYIRLSVPGATRPMGSVEASISDALQKIYALLRMQTNHDFSLYKKNTICRRIERRMHIHQMDDVAEYVNALQNSPSEVNILFKELLIGVTNFFRDAKGFEALRDTWLPELLDGKPEGYTVRVWVAGCSSGEEAYSLAIVLQECMQRLQRHFQVQIFGTDLDEAAVVRARAGIYPESIQADVSAERLKNFFIKEADGRYRIKTTIREMLVFAAQNVIKDPPFTKLDIISCRNLLIYLGPELQQKLFPMFHYGLRPDGILFLGSSESVGKAAGLFAVLDKKHKIFKRTAEGAGVPLVLSMPVRSAIVAAPVVSFSEGIQKMEEISAIQLVETILRQSNTPPCAIIDDACNVIYIHGRTGRYLEPAEGRMSANILEMVRPSLKAVLAAAIHKVAQHKQEVTHRGLCLGGDEQNRSLTLIVRPILEQSVMLGLMMVVFQEVVEVVKKGQTVPEITPPEKRRTAEELEQDLRRTKENLQATIAEMETTNEELKTANEELQSANEELQSTNEEMETSKEELQSLNEEASTVNAELQSRIDDLSKTNDDIKNLLDSTEIATVFLDEALCVRRFTPRATEIIPLTGTDEGRPISHFLTRLVHVDLAEYGERVLKDLAVQEVEVQSKDGRTYIMKVRPYRTANNAIAGVVITFEHITDRKQVEKRLHESEEVYRTILQTALDGFVVLNEQGALVDTNPAYCQMSGYAREELLKMSISELEETGEGESVERLLTNERDRFKTRHRRKGGTFIDIEVSSTFSGCSNRAVIIFVRELKKGG
jgi:two-component system CheB/CheR fusion protein